MIQAIDVVLGFAPGVAWLVRVRRADDWEREPWGIVLRVFALGVIAGLAIAAYRPRIESWYPPLTGDAGLWLDAFAITAFWEELVKLAAVALGALWLAEWDEPMDGIVYGAAAGLGFASVENTVYFATEGLQGGGGLVLARAFTATLAHACFTGAAAFMLGVARLDGWRGAGRMLVAALAIAVALHGAYDVLLMGESSRAPLALVLVLPAALTLFALQARWARARSALYHPVRPTPPGARR